MLEALIAGLVHAAADNKFELVLYDQLQDGFTRARFVHEDDPEESEYYIDFRFHPQKFEGSQMLEVKDPAGSQPNFFISAVPHVLFGAMYSKI